MALAALLLTALLLVSASASRADGPPLLDDFNRADESPLSQGGNWAASDPTGGSGTLRLLSGKVASTSQTSRSYRAADVSGDATVYATVATKSSGNGDRVELLHSLQQVGSASWDGYVARVETATGANPDHWQLYKVTDSAFTLLASADRELQDGEQIALKRTGSTLEFWVSPSGITWQQVLQASDSTYTSGKPGIGVSSFAIADGRLDDFGGGTGTFPPPASETPASLLLDDFNRANENPVSQNGSWAPTGIDGGAGATLSGNQLAGFAQPGRSYRTSVYPADMAAAATITAGPSSQQWLALYVSLQDAGTAAFDGYELRATNVNGPDRWELRRVDNGAVTVLRSTTFDITGGTMLLRKLSSTLEFWWKPSAGAWEPKMSSTDTTYTGGKIGAGGFQTGSLDDFAGGAPPPLTQSIGVCDGVGIHAIAASECLSDPVNTLTGAFTTSLEDLSLPGTGVSFAWSRSYTSFDSTVGRLGPDWTDSYAVSLAVQPNGDFLLHGDEGQQVTYALQPNGSFVGAPGSLSTLSSVTGGYKLVRTDQVVYLFDTQGRLTSMKDRNDQGLTFAYDGQGRLVTITDAAGRQVTVSYNASNLVSSVSTQDGPSVSYGYTAGRLTSLTDVRGKAWTYGYDAGGRLTTIVDPLSHTQVTNVYGTDGRVSTQTDALGKTTTFAFDASTQIATVTDANSKAWKDDYDANVLSKRSDPLPNETLFGHDSDLNTSAVTSPTSETTQMTHDASGNLLQATAPPSLGSVHKTFLYNARNDPTQVTDARGKVTSYAYFPSGNTQSVTQDGIQVASYTYDSAGRVLTYTDGNAKTTTSTYFPSTGYLQSLADPLGNTTTYTYDGAGRVLTRVDPKGNCQGCTPADYTTSYTYNAAGQVLTETDPLGHVTVHTYDDAGNELTLTDANQKTTTYAYDNANRLLSLTAADTGVTTYTYDNVGNKLTEIDPLNHTTTYTYESANRLASSTSASGAKTTSFYDANGNLSKQIEPRGNVGGGVNPDDYATFFTYDAAGRLLTETDPLANVTTHTYDAVGNELTLRDPNLKTTTSTYDGKNRLFTVTAPDGGVTTYTYDNAGNKLTEKDARNNVTTYAYDDANRLASVTTPSGGKKTYAYDANGNQTSMVEPRGNVAGCGCASQYTWTYAFDRANRKLSETSPLGHLTSFAYDNVGNQLSVTDANTHVTAYTYDALNRVKTVTAPDLGVTTHTYDLAGNLTQRKDARNNATIYGYDVDNRRTSVTNPLSKVWTTTYDPAGNVLQTVDANGNATPSGGDGQTTYTYNRSGRLTAIDYSDATPDVTFTYDNAGNRLSMVDGSGSETRTYDPVNRPLSVARGSDTFSYTYDLAGNLTQRSYPGSVSTTYTYDSDNRLATAVNASLSTSYGYDVAGNLTSTTLPSANGYVETRAYDPSGRLTEVKNQKGASLLSRFVITRDPVSNPVSVDRTGGLAQLQTYAYDANDRIATVCFAASCIPSSPERIAWTYDLVGNRLTETRSSGTTSYSYNNGDQLLSAGSTSYTYDANGNELSAGSRTFTWDLANRLKTTTSGSTTTTYTYNGDGARLQASTGNSPNAKTNFLWDVAHALPQVALERNGNDALQRQYIYGLGRIRETVGTASYYHYDGLGSVANLTSATGSTQRTWSYEPYGTMRTSTGSSPTNFWQFTGEYLDPTGLYHLRARQYDPTTGRFLKLDPVDTGIGSSLISAYAYSANRPTALVDPSGEIFQPIDDGQTLAQFTTSPVWPGVAPSCQAELCGGVPVRRVHPIPRRFSTWGGTLIHETDRLPGYPAVDFGGNEGTPVVAVERGEIRAFGNAAQGDALYLRGESGMDYWYGHIRRLVSVGQPVRLGQVIGRTVRYIKYDRRGRPVRADHLHLGGNANIPGERPDGSRAGTDDRTDPYWIQGEAIMLKISRAPRVG